MLIRLHEPLCKSDMVRVVKLIGKVLKYASSWSGTDLDELDFGANVLGADWILRKRTTLIPALKRVLQLEPEQRTALYKAFLNDIQFFANIENAKFKFDYRSLDEDTRNTGADLLIAVEKHGLGVNGGFTKLPDQKTPVLNKHIVEQSYRDANKQDLLNTICPACLGPLPAPIDNTSQVDCEHYFPKAIYPPLAVHPGNLVFVCIPCNQRKHGEEDPIPEGVQVLESCKRYSCHTAVRHLMNWR